MKFLTLLAALSALTTTSAFAANGYYRGTGIMQIEGRPTERCDHVALDMRDDNWGIEIRRFEFECGETNGSMDPRHFDVRGSDIYLRGQRVGTRTPGNTSIQIQDPQTGVVLGLQFTDQYYDAVDVVQEMAAPGFNQRLSASLRLDDANPESILQNHIR
jgi:hypothetical protein